VKRAVVAFAYVVVGVYEGRETIPAEGSGGSSEEAGGESSPAGDGR
jgi:hypothetical protein